MLNECNEFSKLGEGLNNAIAEQVRNDEVSFETNLTTYRPNILSTLKKLAPTSLLPHRGGSSLIPSPNLGEGAVLNEFTSVRTAGEVKKAAFTLAEVLITLGIIGVVAALTMPTLIAKYQKQVFVTQLKKSVNIIENMARKMVADEGVSEFSQTEFYQNFDCYYAPPGIYDDCEQGLNNLKRYLNVLDVNTTTWNYYDTYKTFGATTNDHGFLYLPVKIVLNDGSFIYIEASPTYWGDFFDMALDVNGAKGPNEEGRDLFFVRFDKYGKLSGITWDNRGNVDDSYLERIRRDGWKMNY